MVIKGKDTTAGLREVSSLWLDRHSASILRYT